MSKIQLKTSPKKPHITLKHKSVLKTPKITLKPIVQSENIIKPKDRIQCPHCPDMVKNLKAHIHNTHSNKSKLLCDFCPREFAGGSQLRIHIKSEHLADNQMLCPFCKHISIFENIEEIKQHLTITHNIKPTNFHKHICDYPDCKQISERPSDLRSHKNRHDKTKPKIKCPYNNCKKEYSGQAELDRHIKNKHLEISYPCKIDGCTEISKSKGSSRSHLRSKHNIGVIEFHCNIKGCNTICLRKFDLVRHKERIHEINTTYYPCDVNDKCHWIFVTKSDINRHKSIVHDIGKHKCALCLQHHNSQNEYKDHSGTYKICRKCYNDKTGKSSRAETHMSEFLDNDDRISPFLIGTDIPFRSMGACSLYRPDKFYLSNDIVLHIECDEHQHSYSSSSYQCEEKRISKIHEEITQDGNTAQKYIIIRWNPDHYNRPDGKKEKDSREQRLDKLQKLIHKVLDNPPDDIIHVYYMYYNEDNPQICQQFPFTLMY